MYFIIDNEIESSNKEINKFFDIIINETNNEKEVKNLRSKDFVNRLPEFGFSSIANIIASIKLAKKMKLTKDDAIITVATDGADLYKTELAKTKKHFSKRYDQITCAEIFAKNFEAITVDHTLELSQIDKERIFNLGYYTWVEQQGIDLNDFEKYLILVYLIQRTLETYNKHFYKVSFKEFFSLLPFALNFVDNREG